MVHRAFVREGARRKGWWVANLLVKSHDQKHDHTIDLKHLSGFLGLLLWFVFPWSCFRLLYSPVCSSYLSSVVWRDVWSVVWRAWRLGTLVCLVAVFVGGFVVAYVGFISQYRMTCDGFSRLVHRAKEDVDQVGEA